MNNLFAHILDAAGRAPSAHNTQPWLLKSLENGVEIWLSEPRTLPAVDASYADILHGIGTCLENIKITLETLGYQVSYTTSQKVVFDAPMVIVNWKQNNDTSQETNLYQMIPVRRTSRLPYEDKNIPDSILNELQSLCSATTKLYIITDETKIRTIRGLVKDATLMQFEDYDVSRELYKWLRFSKKDSGWYRDGLNAECLSLNKFESLATRYLLLPKVLNWLSRLHLHKIIFSDVDQHAPKTSTICLLTTNVSNIADRIEAGMTLQRIWLTATKHGLVTHPLSAAVDIEQTCKKVKTEFGVSAEEVHVNLFRLGYSKDCARSHRLPSDEIVL
ncbi:MAG: hypothetical protein K0R98_1465 [Rickettsiaceae bacterium]|jgi:hypothetical protein|nr:hypothetical protein [Rickettsiaceae bacterium]